MSFTDEFRDAMHRAFPEFSTSVVKDDDLDLIKIKTGVITYGTVVFQSALLDQADRPGHVVTWEIRGLALDLAEEFERLATKMREVANDFQ